MIEISKYNTKYQPQLEQIFFLTSQKKQFSSRNEKEEFVFQYLSYYLQSPTCLCFVAHHDHKVLGYVICDEKTEFIFKRFDYYQQVANYVDSFPVHLHINCHPQAQGMGVGRQLIEHLVMSLKQKGLSGVHIITGSDAENIKFYRKLDFSFEYSFYNNTLLFMGRSFI